MITWPGSGGTLEKYLKRPLLFLATFALAHLSMRYFERPFVQLARKISRRVRRRRRDWDRPDGRPGHRDRRTSVSPLGLAKYLMSGSSTCGSKRPKPASSMPD